MAKIFSTFNFPPRYFFAICPMPVFSLRWSLPPALGCIPKQPDSGRAVSGRAGKPIPRYWACTISDVSLNLSLGGGGARPVARFPYATRGVGTDMPSALEGTEDLAGPLRNPSRRETPPLMERKCSTQAGMAPGPNPGPQCAFDDRRWLEIHITLSQLAAFFIDPRAK